ncbi:LuxR C-terminal-related transcriptional regulator [Spirillospora sp. NPDC048911]|uniref:LuxR C-terminal-related transcriptional regulator n=1 Tax=Spirillospora sp. NPDC048911 TaxID=3364527 RepID=UPI00371C787C
MKPIRLRIADTGLTTRHRPPPLRTEWSERPALVRLLAGRRNARLVLVCAPPGYGKSTLVAQWLDSQEETRPYAWISLDRADDSPERLWAAVEQGLGEVGAPESASLVLVLDRFDAIRHPACLDQIAAFIAEPPPGLQLVLIARTEPALPLSRYRISGELAEIRTDDLTFGPAEAGRLIERVSGVRLRCPEMEKLLACTEGWPAGIHLAALSLRDAADPVAFVATFSGTNRHVIDYLAEEVLAALPLDVRGFLTRTSVLGRFCGPLCDAVMGSGGSAFFIERAERAGLFVVPLDDNRTWYRYRHVFRDFLLDQLNGTEPGLVPRLHRRASDWYDRHGMPEEAIDHALAAADEDRALDLIARGFAGLAAAGRPARVQGWLDAIGDDRIGRAPVAALCAARVAAMNGDRHGTRRWLDVAEKLGHNGPLPDGTRSLRSAVALVRSDFGFDGVPGMVDAAETAVAIEDDPSSPWFAHARLNLGYGRYLSGEPERAILPLEEAAQSRDAAPLVHILCLAVLSLAESDLGRIAHAEVLAQVARTNVEELGLRKAPAFSLVFTALGVVALRTGNLDQGRADLEHSLRIRWRTVGLSPWPTVNSLLALAELELDTGDHREASVLTDQAREVLATLSDPRDPLRVRLGDLERRIAAAARTDRIPYPEPLTEREETVLRLLAGDQSLRDIGDRLFLSVNTIKTHTRAIYRKLGASSRTEAIQRARDLKIIR